MTIKQGPFASTLSRRVVLQGAAALLVLPTAARSQEKLEKTSLTIGIGPDFGTSGSAVIALEKGYFKEQGLEQVELKTFSAGLQQVEALVAGGLDVAMPTQAPVLTARSNGIPLVLFASVAAYNDSLALVVREGKVVEKPTDLYGLKIGVLKGSGAEMMVNAIIKHYGLDASKIETVSLAPPEQLSGLSTAAIDAICVWQPWVFEATRAGGKIVHTGTTSFLETNKEEKVAVDWTRGLCCAHERFVRANPKTLEAMVRALADAQAFIAKPENFAEVNTIFSGYQNQSPDMNAVVIKTFGPSIALDERFVNDIEEVQNFLLESNRMKRKVDVEGMLFGGPLRSIDPQLVSVNAKWEP